MEAHLTINHPASPIFSVKRGRIWFYLNEFYSRLHSGTTSVLPLVLACLSRCAEWERREGQPCLSSIRAQHYDHSLPCVSRQLSVFERRFHTHTHKHTHVIKEFFLNSTSFSLGQSRYYLGRQTTFEAFFLPRKNFLALTAEMVRYICSTCLCKEQEFFRQLHNNASLYSFTTSK